MTVASLSHEVIVGNYRMTALKLLVLPSTLGFKVRIKARVRVSVKVTVIGFRLL